MQAIFTGQEYDEENGLQYYGARYLDNEIGRFISVDPAGLTLHDSNEFKEKYDRSVEFQLSDPQNLNSYAYVNNNPVKYTDPTGEILPILAVAWVYVAPYIVPAAITALASASLGYQSSEMYLAITADDQVQSEEHFSNVQQCQLWTAAGTAGLMSVDNAINPQQSKIIPGQKITTPNQVPNNIRNQVPSEWGSGRQADSGKGWVWTDPKNSYNEIRYMSGNPNSSYSSQHQPYIRQSVDLNGQKRYLDNYGNIGVNRSADTHINADEWSGYNY